MSDEFDTEIFDARDVEVPPPAAVLSALPAMPPWLAARLLEPGEKVTWVAGPWLTPRWERYVTHPMLLLAGLVSAVVCGLLGWLLSGLGPEVVVAAALLAGTFLLGSLCLLAIASGYFTRLIVTDGRLIIVQGHEVYRIWGIDDLPRGLIHYGMRGGKEPERTIDLDALKTILGSSDKFTESKTILSLGKRIDQIKRGDDRR
jgi:hypothetical protein